MAPSKALETRNRALATQYSTGERALWLWAPSKALETRNRALATQYGTGERTLALALGTQ